MCLAANPTQFLNSNGRRSLVVDRLAAIRSNVTSLLSNAGFQVTESDDGRDALSILTRPPCLDLLVSETQPPGIDSWKLATTFLSKCPLGRAVLMSPYEDVESINSECPAECRFIPKSRLAEMLLEMVEAFGFLKPVPVILIAEDDPMVRNLIQMMLTKAGYAVLVAADGQEGLDISNAYPGKIDVVISDLQMPRMGGIQMAEHIRKERPGTPLLLISGFSPDTVPAGAEFVNKPFDCGEFTAKVRRLLGSDHGVDRPS